MPLISKPNYNQVFASQAPDQDKPAVFNNYPEGWGTESRPNNGKPTIKGFNYLQQTSDLKDLWILQNGACLPYDESIEYAEGAPVLKDGVIQYKTANGFVGALKTHNSLEGRDAAGAHPASSISDESGKNQQQINNEVAASVSSLTREAKWEIYGSHTELLATKQGLGQAVLISKPEQTGVMSYVVRAAGTASVSPDVLNLNDGRQAVLTNDLNLLKRKVGIFTTPLAFNHRAGGLSYIKHSQSSGKLLTDLSKFKAATKQNASSDFWKEVFIDGTNGNDTNDGLTWTTAKKTISGSIGGNFTKVNIRAGIYHVGNCNLSTVTKTLDTAWVCDDGVAIMSTDISNNIASNWTLQSGTTYSLNLLSVMSITSCVDIKRFDSEGNYLSYEYKATIAEVNATPGSYTYSGGIAYVNTVDGAAPTKDRILLNTAATYFEWQVRPNQKHYLKNMHFMGGTGSRSNVVVKTFNNAVATGSVFYAEGCKFGNIDKRWNNGNAFELFDIDLGIFVNCGVGSVPQDGFNYHGYLRDPHIIEVNCYGGNIGVDNNDNCSSAHENVHIFRIGCVYGRSTGPAVVDVNFSKSYNACLTAYRSRHNLQFDGSVEAWVNGYVGYQQSINDIHLTSGVAGQSKLHIFDNHTEKPIASDGAWSIDALI